nr:hypothetical protein [uncultured Pseudodesulfovibrio sp.]
MSVFDGRVSNDQTNTAFQIKADLQKIYGSSIQWSDYFSPVTPNRVTIRLRIINLGASFGSRIVSSTAFLTATTEAQAHAVGPWSDVAITASSQQSVMAASIQTEGWWNGAAWVDLEVQDLRGSQPISFILPIVAEHQESNVWGYASGDKAAEVAWLKAATQLTRILDIILRTVRDTQLELGELKKD